MCGRGKGEGDCGLKEERRGEERGWGRRGRKKKKTWEPLLAIALTRLGNLAPLPARLGSCLLKVLWVFFCTMIVVVQYKRRIPPRFCHSWSLF